MSSAEPPRRHNDARAKLLQLGWYHSFRFEDGTEWEGVLPLELLEHRYSKFPISADLTGKRVLDIGAWDGWFGFEAESRGADVTAIDTIEVANFWKVHKKLNSKVTYHELDLFELPQAGLGKFDYVFFLGVLYHVKHPVLALELVCGLTRDIAIVESYVIDAENWSEHEEDIPTLEFYESDELAGQLDNWFGPTVGCMKAMCRTAGFARVELLHAENNRAVLACYRKWDVEETSGNPAPRVKDVANNIRGGINFRSNRDEYLSWWFEWEGLAMTREDVRIEVSGFGVPALFANTGQDGYRFANSRLPPGLEPGWHEARLSVRRSAWSAPMRIALDIPAYSDGVRILSICDGKTWSATEVELLEDGGYLSCWVEGIGENGDAVNTGLAVDGRAVKATFVGPPDENGARQVNARLPEETEEGAHTLAVSFGGAQSAPIPFYARRPIST